MSFSIYSHVCDIVRAVKSQKIGPCELIEQYLKHIEYLNPKIKAYTAITADRARARAEKLEQKIRTGKDLGALAGVPFGVKNLYDIKGHTTLAGSKINKGYPTATRDAILLERLENAGAVLLGGLAMGEYAYDFTGENAHYGNCTNPWDTTRMSGGSSSGSGAATAAGIAPISLGSDTNGSIRVPASFCGIFGLKPTYGRLPRTGTFPFCDSLDHLGPLARSTKDLALCFDVLQGYDDGDHSCIKKPFLNTVQSLKKGLDGIRMKKAGGYFSCRDFPDAEAAVIKICKALAIDESVQILGALEGRSAAYLITNIESSALHKTRLQAHARKFDPDTRDRFIAGAMLPAAWYVRAQQVRKWYFDQMIKVFRNTDVIVAPATPCTAPKIGSKTINICGEEHALRPNLGYFTQPISAIGFPSVVVPTFDNRKQLPIGVQIIAAPWREDLCLRVAYVLETKGFSALLPTNRKL